MIVVAAIIPITKTATVTKTTRVRTIGVARLSHLPFQGARIAIEKTVEVDVPREDRAVPTLVNHSKDVVAY